MVFVFMAYDTCADVCYIEAQGVLDFGHFYARFNDKRFAVACEDVAIAA